MHTEEILVTKSPKGDIQVESSCVPAYGAAARLESIRISNFKGVNDTVEIQFRPITLFFGNNSAGKSSVIQAIQYALEILEGKNLDPGMVETRSGGIDLGKFANVVHGHDLNKEIGLAFEFSTLVDSKPAEQWVLEFRVKWSEKVGGPVISYYKVDLGGEPVAEFSTSDPLDANDEGKLSINVRHPKFMPNDSIEVGGDPIQSLVKEDLLGKIIKSIDTRNPGEGKFGEGKLIGVMLEYALKSTVIKPKKYNFYPEETYSVVFSAPGFDLLRKWKDHKYFRAWQDASRVGAVIETDSIKDFFKIDQFCNNGLDILAKEIVVRPLEFLLISLQKFVFLGPIREIPPRNFVASRQIQDVRWMSGLSAWNRLANSDDSFVGKVSGWLRDDKKLDSGYAVRVKRSKLVDVAAQEFVELWKDSGQQGVWEKAKEFFDKLAVQLEVNIIKEENGLEIELLPLDVGTGISQVIPVVVSALGGRDRVVSIEQPELHLHPRMQARLADLFIEAVKDKDINNWFLLETHSEHLALRLQRRVREKKMAPNDISIIFFSCGPNGTTVNPIRLDDEGDFMDDFPGGFFPERLDELC